MERNLLHTATDAIAHEIEIEATRQIVKWGIQFHDLKTWTVIASEELGEVARAALTDDREAMRRELVQLAAAALCTVFEMDLEASGGREAMAQLESEPTDGK